MQQLDIFADSRDVMLRNDVLDALHRRHAIDARRAWQKLADGFPDDNTLAGLTTLIDELERDAATPFADHPALAATSAHLIDEVEPAALRQLGAAAGRTWMASCWRAAAQQTAALPFRADGRELHAAPLWLRAGDWKEARQAVGRIESWRRIPASLAWMAEAQYCLEGVESALPLLTELAWLSPRRLADLLSRLADAAIDTLRRKFDASFDGADQAVDLAWFPAWVLTEKPGLAPLLREAQPGSQTPPERAMRLLLQILSLERQGNQNELVERRKALRDLHAGLYAAYLKTR
ncbi:hypothetical protein E2553_41625 [Paraburkholderia dipogonis]|uniref:Uncharacterized protein n=1 Tax=Paraburkholderia dipogonis TaxID=1211383 RepID=A0A4Y8MKC3_9BURK|nr:hypothetical protein [Paraburkholderia dipogonis]TFE37865.1 hypothetical protein E2553_41625 [Paraburkholderia dipogonis]